MERYTQRDKDGKTVIHGDSVYSDWGVPAGFRGDAVARLAAYEDTGLEPEELAALAEAKKDGRLVVLPCKDGDKIYNTASFFDRLKEPEEHLVEGFYLWRGDLTIICAGATKYGLNKLGKTVFLTRAEAETAIGGGDNAKP